VGGLFGVAGLLGYGPLRERPEPVTSGSSAADPSVAHADGWLHELASLAERRGAGEISPEGFEVAKTRILES
jgi:hypothetical protein